jgi:hypothetical protein
MNSILNQAVGATVPTNSFPTHDDLAAVGPLSRLREIEQLVDSFVASWHAPETILRGRGSYRVGYEKLLLIVPLDDQTQTPVGPAFEVSAQDLSAGGLSFFHADPLPYRLVAISFPEEAEISSSFVFLGVASGEKATIKAGEDFSARWRQQQFPARCLRSPADALTQDRSPKPRRGRRITDVPRYNRPTPRRVSRRPRDTPRVEADTSRPLAIKQHHPAACRF